MNAGKGYSARAVDGIKAVRHDTVLRRRFSMSDHRVTTLLPLVHRALGRFDIVPFVKSRHVGPFVERLAVLLCTDGPPFTDEDAELTRVGVAMEQAKELLDAVNDEVEESKHILQTLANEVCAVRDIVNPALAQQIAELRDHRMVIVREVRDSLTALRDVRDFFLGKDYTTEMERLERFVRLCREIQTLKADGVFDAVVESALRLSVKP